MEFIEHHFENARDFLNALRLSNAEWWTYHPVSEEPDRDWQRDWIFRGESSTNFSDDWKPLYPSAWRKKNSDAKSAFSVVREQISHRLGFQTEINKKIGNRRFFSLDGEVSEDERKRNLSLMYKAILDAFTEITLVNEFIEIADELGFRVARLPIWTKSTAGFVSKYVDLYFPDAKLELERNMLPQMGLRPDPEYERLSLWTCESIALAQHHGISTRLLDWTRNPLYAAYFAASDVKDRSAEDRIAVYALNRETLHQHIQTVQVPSSDNDFFRAQSGIFTFDAKAEGLLLLNGTYPTLEESFRFVGGVFNEILYPKRFTLPVSETSELLRLLWIERVTEAHLMPTLDHVASAVKKKIELIGSASEAHS